MVTLEDWLIEADCLIIQVVQNTGHNTGKMPFYSKVNDVVYSLCIKALKKSLFRLKVTATITWFEKNRTKNGTTKQLYQVHAAGITAGRYRTGYS